MPLEIHQLRGFHNACWGCRCTCAHGLHTAFLHLRNCLRIVLKVGIYVFQDLLKDKPRYKFKNSRFKYPKTHADLDAERKTKKIRTSTAAADVALPKYGPPEYDEVPAARKAGYVLKADNWLSADAKRRIVRRQTMDAGGTKTFHLGRLVPVLLDA